MALNAWLQPKFIANHTGKKLVNLTSDTLVFGLIASGALAGRGTTEGYEFVSDLLANGGSALTEVATGGGTNYSRQNAASVTYTLSGLVITLNMSNFAWVNANFTTVYGWLHDETASSGTDATRPLLTIYDFNGAQNPSNVTFTLTVNASGIWTATVSQ